MSDTIHKIVTERMIAALQRSTVPWRKPWQAATGQPRSMSTGQPYRGVNTFLLALTAGEEGYGSPFWGTYRQISDLGGQVRKSERSTLVVFWKRTQVDQCDPQTGEITVKPLPLLRYYRVFNAAQADNLSDRFHPAPGEHVQLTEPQAVLDGYLSHGPALIHVAGDRADYHTASDTIRLPLPGQFRSPEGYYATAFHEAGHSTGHSARLNRPGIAAFDHFGSGKYAREELVAQMTSSLMCANTGIDNEEVFDNSASYVASWLSALANDHKLVIIAAGNAQRACDLINQLEREPAKDIEPHSRATPARDGHATATTNAVELDPGPDGTRSGGRLEPVREAGVPAAIHRGSATPGSPSPARAGVSASEQARAARIGDWQAEAG